MSIFGKDNNEQPINLARDLDDEPQTITVEDRAYQLRENAIQYIVELPDKDLENFIESARLIRDGRRKLETIRTEDEKQAEKEAREAEKQADTPQEVADEVDNFLDDDELTSAFLEDDDASPVKKKPTRRK